MDTNKPQELIDYEIEKEHKMEERLEKKAKMIKVRKNRKSRHFFAVAGRLEEEDE